MIKITGYKPVFSLPKFKALSNKHSNNTNTNHLSQITMDTVSFSGKAKTDTKKFTEKLGFDSQDLYPYNRKLVEAEQARRQLKLDSELIGLNLDIPEQFEYKDAVKIQLRLHSATAKINQAKRKILEAEEAQDKDKLKAAIAARPEAIQKAKDIRKSISLEERRESEEIIARFKNAREEYKQAVNQIKFDACVEELGKIVEEYTTPEEIGPHNFNNCIDYSDDEYTYNLLRKVHGDNINAIQESEKKIGNAILIKLLGIKKANPTENDISDNYYFDYNKKLYEQGIITWKEYKYAEYY